MRTQLTFLLIGLALLTLTSCSYLRTANPMDVEADRQALREFSNPPE